jgi:ribonucleoside-diphosphate reductase beta chain
MALNLDSFPLKEIRRGRELQWDPNAIDFSQDRNDWANLAPLEQRLLLNQVIGFLIGERIVAHDLAPLQMALRKERGRMEEEMYITQQLFEESNHVEFFQRWVYEVLPGELGKDIPFPSSEPSPLLHVALPQAMNALLEDTSQTAQIRAIVAYHQNVEGVSAEVGYQIFYDCMDQNAILPGLREGVRKIQIDESRHIAFGTYLAQRIINETSEMKQVFIDAMEEIKQATVRSTAMLFELFESPYPFDLQADTYISLTRDLHARRTKAVLEGHLIKA